MDTHVSAPVGNIFIKYNDKWRGALYLYEDMTFGTDKNQAAKFYLLKCGDGSVLNGDRISINSGNKVLSIIDNDIRMVDRLFTVCDISDPIIITNGNDDTDPVLHDVPYFFITNKDTYTALKYEVILDLADMSKYNEQHPKLVNATYNNGNEPNVQSFQFYLEKVASHEQSTSNQHETQTQHATAVAESPVTHILDKNKPAIFIILLFLVLLMVIFLSNQ